MQPAAIECQSRIRDAAADQEIVRLVNAFVATIAPELIAMLPGDCRPHHLDDRDAIMAYNVQLARAELLCDESAAPYAEVLRTILAVTTQAATRFTQLSSDGLLAPDRKRD
jgi:hypothetical protein